MALIADETVLEVKNSTDVVEVVQGYIPLKRAGSSYKALCPFHEEKSPSFTVNPERQTFKCFGCGKGGDAIAFVMEYEKLDYPDAIKVLADKLGVPIKYKEGSHDGLNREDLYKANEWAKGVFRNLLLKAPEADEARQFIARRGVNDETSELFGLGYSMDSWDHLIQRGRRAGFGEKLLAAAGLIIEKAENTGFYDRFRGRLMFPIADHRGKVIAFGARTLTDQMPKFLNGPETAIFSKGRSFYGLHLAKDAIDEVRTAYIVEGYMDVIIPFQAGFKQMVAPMGTALTKEHVKVLRRYADKIILMFDSDAAGQKASEKSLDLLLSENVDIFVAKLPAGMDPDDVVIKQGPEALKACLENPREIFDFMLDYMIEKHGFETPAAKARIVDDMIERIATVPDPVRQELLIQPLAARLNMPEAPIRGRLFRKLGVEGAGSGEKKPEAGDPEEQRSKEILACAFSSSAFAKRVREECSVEGYPTPLLKAIAEKAYELFDQHGQIDGQAILSLATTTQGKAAIAEIVDMQMTAEEADKRGAEVLGMAISKRGRSDAEELSRSIKKLESGDDINEKFRKSMEEKKRTGNDHGRFPGRD